MLEQDSREEALQAASKESVDQIVEVCNVSREDAFRVLQRCDFDVQLAIERFLMGEEEWYEVPKKKKPAERKQVNATRGSARSGGTVAGPTATAGVSSYGSGTGGGGGGSGGGRNPAGMMSSRSGNAGGNRGRRQKGPVGIGRNDREYASTRKATGGEQPAWANSTTNKEKLPEWALPSNTPTSAVSSESRNDFTGGGWGGNTVGGDRGWESRGDGIPEQSSWGGLEKEVEKNVLRTSPVNASGGSVMAGGASTTTNIETPPAAVPNSTSSPSNVATTKSTLGNASDGLKPKLNFAAVVAAGTIHDKKVQTPKEPIAVPSATSSVSPVAKPVAATSAVGTAVNPADRNSGAKTVAAAEPTEPIQHSLAVTREAEQAESDALLSAWSPATISDKTTEAKGVSPEAAAAMNGSDVPVAKTERMREPLMSNLSVNQLGLQFGSFALDGDSSGAVGGVGATSDGDWNKASAGVASTPSVAAPASANTTSVGSGARSLNGLNAVAIGGGGSTVGTAAGSGSAPMTTSAPSMDPNRTQNNMFAQNSAYAMQHAHPHQQYSMMPIPYAQFDGQQAGARRGMQSGQMQGYYDPLMAGMVPPSAYREVNKSGMVGSDSSAASGNAAAGAKQMSSRAGAERQGVPNALNNPTMEQLNSYMISPGFPPYASLYAFPHNPYGGPAMEYPQPPYPQYAQAGGAPHRGRGGLEGYDEGGYNPANAESGADNHMYGPVAYLGVPMMADVQQQHHHNQQRGKNGDVYKPASTGARPSAPSAGLEYPADYGNPSQQHSGWGSGTQTGGNRPTSARDGSNQQSQPGQTSQPQTPQQSLQQSSQPQHLTQPNQNLDNQPQDPSGYYPQAPSGGHYPFYPAYY